jgi:hypothetical protein
MEIPTFSQKQYTCKNRQKIEVKLKNQKALAKSHLQAMLSLELHQAVN